jgi:hypothetical protein
MPMGERSGLLTRIAATESAKSALDFLWGVWGGNSGLINERTQSGWRMTV